MRVSFWYNGHTKLDNEKEEQRNEKTDKMDHPNGSPTVHGTICGLWQY